LMYHAWVWVQLFLIFLLIFLLILSLIW
jgi:hypothetical protein